MNTILPKILGNYMMKHGDLVVRLRKPKHRDDVTR